MPLRVIAVLLSVALFACGAKITRMRKIKILRKVFEEVLCVAHERRFSWSPNPCQELSPEKMPWQSALRYSTQFFEPSRANASHPHKGEPPDMDGKTLRELTEGTDKRPKLGLSGSSAPPSVSSVPCFHILTSQGKHPNTPCETRLAVRASKDKATSRKGFEAFVHCWRRHRLSMPERAS